MYHLEQDAVNPVGSKRFRYDLSKVAKLPRGTIVKLEEHILTIEVGHPDFGGTVVRKKVRKFSSPGYQGSVRADSSWGRVIENAIKFHTLSVRSAIEALGRSPEMVLEQLEKIGKLTGDDILALENVD